MKAQSKKQSNQVVWFDMPVKDLGRSMNFYTQVLKVSLSKPYPEMEMAVFDHGDKNPEADDSTASDDTHTQKNDIVSGCLVVNEDSQPSPQGALLYFNAEGRLTEAVAQVVPAGGKILQPQHQIGPFGYRAIVLDSEGNRIALYSRSPS